MIYIILIAALILLFIVSYNSLIKRKNDVENGFASVDVMLKKRYDLIPNLLETVKAYMKHEKNLLLQITRLRIEAVSSKLSDEDKVNIENKITKSMSGLMVAVENYPDLKANQNFLQLQGAWNEVEEQISAARRAYNAAVTSYNNVVEIFPSNIIAGIMKFKRKLLFEIPDYEKHNIKAKELFSVN